MEDEATSSRRRDEHISSAANTKAKDDKGMDTLRARTGGAYIPPARLKLMQENIKDKNSVEYQRIAWEALKKSINGLINKVNVSNIEIIVQELFNENIIRGRGLLVRSIIQAQTASSSFTSVYASLTAIINSKFPQIGELILKRLILQFKRSYKRNDKQTCLSSIKFIAHLVNQSVAHEVLALELLTLLLENTTNDSVEVAIAFLKECGMKMTEITPRGILAIFERLRTILHEGNLDKRVQYMIEVMFAVRKDGFKDHQAMVKELDLVEEGDLYTHVITLEDEIDSEDRLNVFRFDENYESTEEKYKAIKRDILVDLPSDESGVDDDDDDEDDEEEEEEESEDKKAEIIDNTETNLIELRRRIYLTIQSSLDYEECAHKLLKLELKPGQMSELCHMIVDCCAQQRTYFKFFGFLAQRFCLLSEEYVQPFTEIFKNCYDIIHRFETNKLRNLAKLFAHLLFTDSIPWTVLSHIKLNEDDTTSSSRVFIKVLIQELSEYMGQIKLNERIKDPTLQEAFDGLFPRDNPRNTRFSINYFTSIGLGGLTLELRQHLENIKTQNIPIVSTSINIDNSEIKKEESPNESVDSDSSSSSSSSSSASSSSSSSDSSSHRKSKRKSRRSKRKEEKAKHKHKHRRDKDKKHEKSSKITKSDKSYGNKNEFIDEDNDDSDGEIDRKVYSVIARRKDNDKEINERRDNNEDKRENRKDKENQDYDRVQLSKSNKQRDTYMTNDQKDSREKSSKKRKRSVSSEKSSDNESNDGRNEKIDRKSRYDEDKNRYRNKENSSKSERHRRARSRSSSNTRRDKYRSKQIKSVIDDEKLEKSSKHKSH